MNSFELKCLVETWRCFRSLPDRWLREIGFLGKHLVDGHVVFTKFQYPRIASRLDTSVSAVARGVQGLVRGGYIKMGYDRWPDTYCATDKGKRILVALSDLGMLPWPHDRPFNWQEAGEVVADSVMDQKVQEYLHRHGKTLLKKALEESDIFDSMFVFREVPDGQPDTPDGSGSPPVEAELQQEVGEGSQEGAQAGVPEVQGKCVLLPVRDRSRLRGGDDRQLADPQEGERGREEAVRGDCPAGQGPGTDAEE